MTRPQECSGRRVVLERKTRIEEVPDRDVAVQNLRPARQMDEVIVGVFDCEEAKKKGTGDGNDRSDDQCQYG